MALGALLLGEGLVLGIAFDSAAAQRLPRGWWTPLLALAGAAMPAATALLAAAVLVGWSTLRPPSPIPSSSSPSSSSPSPSPLPLGLRSHLLVLHLVSFVVLFLLCRWLFDGRLDSPEHTGLVVLGWVVAALATPITWLGALVPFGRLAAFARTHRLALALSVALGVAAFAVGRLAQGLWLPLRRATFAVAASTLRLFVPDATADADALIFGTEVFEVEIAPSCSGYEGVGLTWVFLLAALWLFRDRWRFPRALLLLAVGTVLPWLANTGRLVGLVLLGTYVSPELAAGGFHSYAGSILFCAIALGLVAAALGSGFFARVPPAEERVAGPNPAAPYLVPFLALVAAGMIARAFATGADEPLYPLRTAAGALALALYGRRLRGLRWWRASAVAAPAGIAAALAWILIEQVWPGASPGAPPGARVLALRLATALVIAPVAEELAFRGFLARRVSAADFESVPPERLSLAGVAVSSLAFGLLHQRPVAGVVAGAVYALAYRRRGLLGDAIVAHAVTNAALAIAAAITGNWGLWL